MFEIRQRPDRIKKIVGYNCITKKIYRIPVRCVRKPTVDIPICPYFCFVSNPGLIQCPGLNPFMWLHCYRDPKIIPTNTPKYLMPESDFMDPCHCPVFDGNKIKYDYSYFSISGPKGDTYKGLDNFIKDVSVLNGLGLRGIVVFYNGIKQLGKNYMKVLQKNNVTIHGGRLQRSHVVKIMSQSKFGIFPNKADCSPRMIPEFFLQNRPVIVNENILGGWHYFDDKSFGCVYKPGKTLKSAVETVSNLPLNQRSIWMSKYGFNRCTKQLRDLLMKHFPCDEVEQSTHVYFKDFKPVFIECGEIFS